MIGKNILPVGLSSSRWALFRFFFVSLAWVQLVPYCYTDLPAFYYPLYICCNFTVHGEKTGCLYGDRNYAPRKTTQRKLPVGRNNAHINLFLKHSQNIFSWERYFMANSLGDLCQWPIYEGDFRVIGKILNNKGIIILQFWVIGNCVSGPLLQKMRFVKGCHWDNRESCFRKYTLPLYYLSVLFCNICNVPI